MLVHERMSKPVVFVNPNMPVQDALQLMKRENIRRTPVIKDGKLVGIISDKDLMDASPSRATSLSVWELNYLISKIKVADVMTEDVIVIDENTPIEEAARIMADNKIGGLPVMKDGDLVGIITETDLFHIFLELMSARELGVRATVMVLDKPGELAKITSVMAENQGNILAVGTFSGETQNTRGVMIKVSGIEEEDFKMIIGPLVTKIIDIRTCCN